MATLPCEILEWDSGFFGCRIGRLLGGRLDRELLAAVDAWCRDQAVDCLYFLADGGDSATTALAEEAGFRLTDLRVTLDREASALRPPLPSPAVRPARPDDVPALRRIAAASHHDSRFYADPRFERSRCDELYATWIEKSCRGAQEGLADEVLVAELKEREEPAGYISSLVRAGERGPEGEIGLLAVAADAQGHGLGGALVGAALRRFQERGAARVRVVTQGRNPRAQRLYQASGLLTRSIGLWFHRWQEIP